jgi:hypothetical protein
LVTILSEEIAASIFRVVQEEYVSSRNNFIIWRNIGLVDRRSEPIGETPYKVIFLDYPEDDCPKLFRSIDK